MQAECSTPSARTPSPLSELTSTQAAVSPLRGTETPQPFLPLPDARATTPPDVSPRLVSALSPPERAPLRTIATHAFQPSPAEGFAPRSPTLPSSPRAVAPPMSRPSPPQRHVRSRQLLPSTALPAAIPGLVPDSPHRPPFRQRGEEASPPLPSRMDRRSPPAYVGRVDELDNWRLISSDERLKQTFEERIRGKMGHLDKETLEVMIKQIAAEEPSTPPQATRAIPRTTQPSALHRRDTVATSPMNVRTGRGFSLTSGRFNARLLRETLES